MKECKECVALAQDLEVCETEDEEIEVRKRMEKHDREKHKDFLKDKVCLFWDKEDPNYFYVYNDGEQYEFSPQFEQVLESFLIAFREMRK